MATFSPELSAKIHNEFDIEVVDGRTGKIKQKAKAYNVILNRMWGFFINTPSSYAFGKGICYGSGTGTPSTSDTGLFNYVGGKVVSEVSLNIDYDNQVITRVCKITLGVSEAVNVTLREIGLACGPSSEASFNYSSYVTTHAILQDMNGNPISITKTNTDIVNIYATVYCHWVESPNVILYFSTNLAKSLTGSETYTSSTSLSVTCFAEQTFNSSFSAGFSRTITRVSNARSFGKSSDSTLKKFVYTSSRVNVDEANLNGIGYILGTDDFSGIAIKKGTNTWDKFTIHGESVGIGDGTTNSFKTKFSFPYNATVYINGVAVNSNDVQVKNSPVDSGMYLLRIDNSKSTAQKPLLMPTSNNDDHPDNATFYYFNPWYTEGMGAEQVSINASAYGDRLKVYGSDDLLTWDLAVSCSAPSPTVCDVPAAQRARKFYKAENTNGYLNSFTISMSATGKNIIFDTPPAEGDVITIDYDTDCIPKDSDHVLDVSVTFQFGEYQGA